MNAPPRQPPFNGPRLRQFLLALAFVLYVVAFDLAFHIVGHGTHTTVVGLIAAGLACQAAAAL